MRRHVKAMTLSLHEQKIPSEHHNKTWIHKLLTYHISWQQQCVLQIKEVLKVLKPNISFCRGKFWGKPNLKTESTQTNASSSWSSMQYNCAVCSAILVNRVTILAPKMEWFIVDMVLKAEITGMVHQPNQGNHLKPWWILRWKLF